MTYEGNGTRKGSIDMTDTASPHSYDVLVIGAGHAGCEAALAAARMGCRTALFTANLDSIALMPCNPAIGGIAKGHLVREIDALGGVMAQATEFTYAFFEQIMRGKGFGSGVWSTRENTSRIMASRHGIGPPGALRRLPVCLPRLVVLPGRSAISEGCRQTKSTSAALNAVTLG